MAKFVTKANIATWWPKLELMLNADCISCWPNFYPMQVAFYLAKEITQVQDAIPWVRCASGNVYNLREFRIKQKDRNILGKSNADQTLVSRCL